jgi:hypothetical protein
LVLLWKQLTGFCRNLFIFMWLCALLYFGIEDAHPYGVRTLLRRNEYKKRVSTSRHAPTPLLPAVPQALMALSYIQIRMWFVQLSIGSQYWWTQLITDVADASVNDLLDEGVPWFLLNMLWFFLIKKPPETYYEVNGVLIAQRPRSYVRRLFIMLVYIILFTGCAIHACEDFELKMSALHLDALREVIDTSEQILSACATSESLAASNSTPRPLGSWDSDTFLIVIDSATTRTTITPYFSDLIDPKPFRATLSGLGTGSISHKGKVRWTVLNKQGRHVFMEDDDAYYSPHGCSVSTVVPP